jgi:hypothetical protein
MLILFTAGTQEKEFSTDGGAVGGGHSVSRRYQQRHYEPSGGGFGGGHASQRRFFLTEIVPQGGAVGGGHSVHRSKRSFSPAGGAVAGGKQKSPRTRRFHSSGGAVAGGHVAMTFIGASANMRELQLEGNAAGMLQLAGVLEGEGFRVVMKTDFLGFWLWFDTTGIVIYFDLVDRGLMRVRQAINSGTDAVPIWCYGTPVYLFLNYYYDSAGWLFFTTKYIYIVARHDRYNQYPYDCIFAGAANSPTGQLDGCLALIGGSTTQNISLMPLTTTEIVAAGITMNKATLAGQSVLHLKSLSSYFGAGKNGNSEGQGVTATEIIVCDSTSQVRGSLPNARSTQGANLQTEQIIKTPSSRWLCFQNNNTSVILQR